MKMRAVVEVTTETYEQQQLVLSRFPDSIWIPLNDKTLFFIDYSRYAEIIDILKQVNLTKVKEKKKGGK